MPTKKRPFGLQGVPHFRPTPEFPNNPHTMTNAEIEESWERDHMRFQGKKSEAHRDHVSRLEFEIRKRGI